MAKSADAFRTISEVADWLGVQTHVLRFWESKFTQVKPVKRAGGRRYYRPVDMLLLGGIRKLLHEDGLTIKGVQKILREKGMAHVSALSPGIDGVDIEVPKPLAQSAPEPVIKPDTIEPAEPIVPLAKEPAETILRPSFTQDAVVMPEPNNVADEDVSDPNETVEVAGEDVEPDLAPAATDDTDGMAQTLSDSEPVTAQVSDDAGFTDDALTESSASEVVETEEPPKADKPDVKVAATDNENASQGDDTNDPDPTWGISSLLDRVRTSPPDTDNLPPEDNTAAPTEPEPVLADAEPTPSHDTSDTSVVSDVEETEPTETLATESSAENIETPKPIFVDVPETPNEVEFSASPRALSAMAKLDSVTPAQAKAIAPLLAQLRDVRDRMTQARKE